MKSLAEHTLDKAIMYHVENNIPFYENVFRPHSNMSNALFKEAKSLYEEGSYKPSNWFEKDLLETDIGEFDIYEGVSVPLDFPLQEAEYKGEKVELGKPKRGGSKKFYVYVKDPSTGNVKKIEWGDTTGLKVKLDDPKARKSFAARHQCSTKKDKTTPGYWACRTPMYSTALGLSSGGNFFW